MTWSRTTSGISTRRAGSSGPTGVCSPAKKASCTTRCSTAETTGSESIGHTWADGFGGQLPPSVSELGFREGVGVQDQHEVEVGWKSDFYYDVGSSGTFNAGVDVYHIDLDYAYTQNGTDTLYQFTSSVLPPDADQKYVVVHPEDVNHRFDDAAVNASAYTSYAFGIGRLMLTPGIRYSYSGFSTNSRVAPRLQVRYSLDAENHAACRDRNLLSETAQPLHRSRPPPPGRCAMRSQPISLPAWPTSFAAT